MPAVKTLDLRGEICPDPLIQVQGAVRQASSGDSFLIRVDYPLAVENIARWAEAQGFAVAVDRQGGEWEISIRIP